MRWNRDDDLVLDMLILKCSWSIKEKCPSGCWCRFKVQKRDWAGGLDLGVINRLIIIEARGVDEIVSEKCAHLIWREDQGQNCYR